MFINIIKNKLKYNNLVSISIIFIFLISDQISILNSERLPFFDNLPSFIIKYVILVVTWVAAFMLLYYVAMSGALFKWGVFSLITISTLVFDIFSAASYNTLLYSDYLGLRVAVSPEDITNVFNEYAGFFIHPVCRLILLFIAFLMLPSTISSKNPVFKALILLVFCLAIFVIMVIKQETSIRKMPGFLSIYGFEVARLFEKNNYQYNYNNLLIEPKSKPIRQNVILVIDESIRYDFINGEESNEELNVKSNRFWNVYDYGSATSGNNCSGYSNIILRKGPKPENLGEEIQKNPLIWAYAQKAGYRTSLIDAQRSGKGHDYFDSNELKMIDNNVDTSNYKSDRDIAIELAHLLKNPGNFIIVIKKGAHFPYVNKYPESFTPIFKSSYINQTQKRIEYARAIKYQTGGFFEELLKQPLSPSTVLVYTSDHGQNLEDTKGTTHCTMNNDPYNGEGLVPMLLIDNQINEQANSYSDINHNKSSHFNIFSTLLYFFGYEKNDYLKNYGLSLFDPIDRFGKFNYGSPFGYFGSKPKFVTTDEKIVHGFND